MKKIISTMLVITLLVSQLLGLYFMMPIVTYAETAQNSETNVADKYFYNQLDEDGKTFYNIFKLKSQIQSVYQIV